MPEIVVSLIPAELEAPSPDRIHGDRSPADRWRRESAEERRAALETRATESPEEHDARIYKYWVNYDGITFTSDYMTIADIAAEEDEGRCTPTCPCWRHCVLRHYERMQTNA